MAGKWKMYPKSGISTSNGTCNAYYIALCPTQTGPYTEYTHFPDIFWGVKRGPTTPAERTTQRAGAVLESFGVILVPFCTLWGRFGITLGIWVLIWSHFGPFSKYTYFSNRFQWFYATMSLVWSHFGNSFCQNNGRKWAESEERDAKSGI